MEPDDRKAKIVMTCSNCINDSLLGPWSFTWDGQEQDENVEVKQEFLINDSKIKAIQEWVNTKMEEKRVRWGNLFSDVDTAKEYKQLFFSHLPDLKIMAIYFSELETAELIKVVASPEWGNLANGLYENLEEKTLEQKSASENFLGLDLIGVDISADFHSFHCHDFAKDLYDKFGLMLNGFGLYDQIEDVAAVAEYLNDEETGLASVPWFVVKVKLVQD